jgi:hypothetical protein
MKPEDKLGTLEEAIEFNKKRNYQYTAPRELSDDELLEYVYAFSEQRCSIYSFQEDNILEMIRTILKKAREKC